MNKNLKILSVKYVHGYILQITFNDNEVKEIDFYHFLNNSTNAEIRSYLVLEKFKNYKLINGDLMWGDFDLLFPIHDIYNRKIS